MNTFVATPEQALALNARMPLLVLAGAGTGKTTVLTQRIAATIRTGIARPDEVLALTFTEKAANEMSERLASLLGEEGPSDSGRQVTALTFHSFGMQVIGENLLALAMERPPSVQSTAGAWQLLASLFDELAFDTIEIGGRVSDTFSRLLRFFDEARDNLVSPEDVERYADGIKPDCFSEPVADYLLRKRGEAIDLAAAYRIFTNARVKRGLVGFGDLLYLPTRLFVDRPDIRDVYRRRFTHVYVDEYQDTNSAQRQLLMQLIDPERPNVMVIGDDDQSIYRWRGAVVDNILDFPREPYLRGQVTLAQLTLNRRSTQTILDVANRAIEQIDPSSRYAKTLLCHPKNADETGRVGRAEFGTVTEEGEFIAETINSRLQWANGLDQAKRGFGAFAVLCRKRMLFQPICDALDRAGIPYELVGGSGFYDRWEIRDLLSYLRIVAQPGDDVALARLLLSRRFRLDGREVSHLASWVRRNSGPSGRGVEATPKDARIHLIDAVLAAAGPAPTLPTSAGRGYDAELPDLPPAPNDQCTVHGISDEARRRLKVLVAELAQFDDSRRTLPLGEFVSLVIEKTAYRDELLGQNGFDSRLALLNIDKLDSLAHEFADSDPKASLRDFIDLVRYSLDSGDEESEVRPVDESANTVKVMTVHQAKGLEYPAVFVPGLSTGIFPPRGRSESDRWEKLPVELRGDCDHRPHLDLTQVRSDKDLKAAFAARNGAERAQQLDEERRLFYVALTRAERELYLSRSDRYGSERKPRAGSEFWDVAVECVPQLEADADCSCARLGTISDKPTDEDTEGGEGKRVSATSALMLPDDQFAAWLERETSAEPDRWANVKAETESIIRAALADPPVEPQIAAPLISVSALCLYLSCRRHYRYLYIDRLPRRPSAAAALGDEVHRLIEEASRDAAVTTHADVPAIVADPNAEDATEESVLTEIDDRSLDMAAEEATTTPYEAPPDPRGDDSPPTRMSDQSGGADDPDSLVGAYRQSRFGRRPATHIELPFELRLANGILRGRIDRLDQIEATGEAGGPRWEVIDFKSGVHNASAEEYYRRQLALYALAVVQDFGVSPDRITAHILFLRDGADYQRGFSEADLAATRAEAESSLSAIARGEFDCRGNMSECGWCEYAGLCEPASKSR